MKWFMLLPLTAALASATTAAAPAGAPVKRPAPFFEQVGTPAFEALMKANGMSDAGIARLRGATVATPSSETLQAAMCAVEAAQAATPLDVAALDRALAQRDAISTERAARHRAALIGWLQRLDTADAAVLLKLVGTGDDAAARGGPPPGGPGGAGGPGGPPPPGGRHDGPPPGPPPGGGPESRCG